MSDPLALIGATVGEFRIQRKRRSFDPFAGYWEAIHKELRETYWLLAYPPVVLEKEELSANLQEEWLRLQRMEHAFWMACGEHIHTSDPQQWFVAYPSFARSQQLSELNGKLRPAQLRKLFYYLADVLATAHHHGICGWLDPRHVYVRRQGEEVDLRWYRTPSQYINLMPSAIEATDLNEWLSYQSPEYIAGDRPTPASDYFSLGTILYETVTGKRAFYHRSEDAVVEKLLSGSLPDLQKSRLTLEQGEFLAALWERDPEKRLTKVKEFQFKIRELFPDQSPFAADYMPTDEHPALLVKESQPPSMEELNHISLSGSHASYAAIPQPPTKENPENLTAVSTKESPENLIPISTDNSSSSATEIVQAIVPESLEDTSLEASSSKARSKQESMDFPAMELPATDTDQTVQTSALSRPKEQRKDKKQASKESLHAKEPETWHSKSIIRCHKQLNVRKIHPLTVQIVASEHYTPSESLEQEPWHTKTHSPYIRIVPVLPGCMVSPQEAVVDSRTPRVEARFWVVPLASVNIMDAATIQLWHGGLPKDEIPIPCHIRSQLITKIAGTASALSFIAGAAFEPSSNIATQADLASQFFHQTITLFANYGLWFGFFFLFAAMFSYYWLRPQANTPITYLLTEELPHPSSFHDMF